MSCSRVLIVAALAVSALTRPMTAAGTSDQAKVDAGVLKGAVDNGVMSFKGIPFAAPPVGDLRWKPPQPVTPWTGVRPATAYGSDCMQLPFPGDAAPSAHRPLRTAS